MPALSAPERALFDITQYPSIGFVYISQPALIFEAPLTGGFYSAGAVVALSFGTPTVGSFSDIQPEMTLELWDDNANIYGSQRIRAVATATAIFVGRSPQGVKVGELTIADSATIKVYKERKVWTKTPYIAPNGTQYKDQTAYSTDNAAQPPVANAGADVLIIVPDGTTTATIALNALGDVPSFAVRNGATLSSYLWDLDDGSVATGTLTSSSLTGTFPLGERYVSLRVQDSNGIQHRAYKFVVIATKAMCTPVKIAEEVIRARGISWRFTVNSDLLPSGIREGAKVLYTQHDDYDLDQIAVRFSGWLGTENFSLKSAEKQQREITIPCYDIAERARQVYGFPLTVEISTGQSGWYRMPNANIDRLTHHYLQWHTNILSLADFGWSGQGATYPLPRFTTDGATIWEQGDRLARAIAYALTCNTHGQIRVKGDPIILPTAAQAAQFSLPTQRTSTVVTTLAADDYGEFEIETAQAPRVYWLRGAAVVAGIANQNAVKAAAPSKTPGQGYSTVEETEMLVINQAELNARLANRYAARVNPRVVSVTLNMVKTRHVFELADMEWVTIVFPAYVRAKYPYFSVDGDRFLPVEMVNRYDLEKLRKNTSITFEMEVAGVVNNDMTVVDPPPPASNPNNPNTTGSIWIDNFVPVEPLAPPMLTIHGLPPASQNLLAVLNNGRIAVTGDFDTPSFEGGPTWTVYNHSATLGADVRAFTYNANGASGVCGWFVTPDDIIYGEDLETATPTFDVQSSFPATVEFANIDSDYAINPGLFVVCVFAIDEGAVNKYYARVSLNGGTTWQADVLLNNAGSNALLPSGLHVATQQGGTAWTTAGVNTDAWCYEFSVAEGNFDEWSPYNTGLGDRAQLLAGGWARTGANGLIQIQIAFSSSFITDVSVYTDTAPTLYHQLRAPDVDGSTFSEQIIGGLTASYTLDVTTTGLWVSHDYHFSNPDPGLITKIVICGTGVNPFLSGESDGLRIYKTIDYGATWVALANTASAEAATGGVFVALPDADMNYLFLGNYVETATVNPDLVDDDSNNLMRVDLNTETMTNISPIVDGESYGPVYVSGVNAPRISFETPSGNINILYMLGSEKVGGKIGLFKTSNALATSPEWDVLIEPDVSVPYRKLVLDSNPRELYVFGINGSIGFTDSPTDGSTLDVRTGDLSTAAEIIAVAGWTI